MRSVKTLVLGITLAAAARNVYAQDATGAAQQVRKSAEQAAQGAGSANKPAAKPGAQAPAKPAAQGAAQSRPAGATPATGKPGGAVTPKQAAKSATPQAAKPGGSAGKPQAKARAAGATKKAAAKKPGVKRAAKAKPSGAAQNAQAVLEHETRVARRDPFEAMIGRENAGASKGNILLPPGLRGLQVSTLRLDGVVRAPNGMIAVVSNPQNRTYFLREGDQLYDGRVEKIAMDGVSFHEVGKDAFGKPVERQVNKRIYASAGEQL
jgi:Tfp pilus assembly protein PilP